MKKVLLIDGHSLLFRAFYALPMLTNASGEFTGAVYGFMNIFLKLLEEEKPDTVITAFDLPEPTFRHELYGEYKGTRKPTPPEFAPQVPLLQNLLAAMKVTIVSLPGYEADDIIGTLANKFAKDDVQVVIITGDRDLLQLAAENVKIRLPKPKTGTTEDFLAADVHAKYGVSPTAFIDVKALMGDQSDNIPGVPGIGEKTAVKIIAEYGTVENAIAHAISNPDKIKPKKAAEALKNFSEQAILSKELATICVDAPINFQPVTECNRLNLNSPEVLAELKRLGFKTLAARLMKPNESYAQASMFEDAPVPRRGATYTLRPGRPGDAVLPQDAEDTTLPRDAEGQTYTFAPYEDLPPELQEVLQSMEKTGIKINIPALISYGEKLQKHIHSLTTSIHNLAGEEFNINSPSQLSVVLFEKLQLKGGKKTKQGYSTAADVLEKLRTAHPIIEHILAYRTYAKLKSTYVDGLLPLVGEDSRVRSTFNQPLTSTGRIRSTEPNLQNIPIRLEVGRELRRVFVPADGFVFMDADYSQIELRILAHMADDAVLIEAFRNNEDIHSLTASQVFGVPQSEVTSEMRRAAKAVNFGIIYGISAFGLGEDLGISRYDAAKYIEGYFTKYPRIKAYLDKTVADAKQNGYTTTLFGHRRYIPELASKNHATRAFGERAAMNMPIQGTAADIIKTAMIAVFNRLKEEGLASRIVLQVHDELLLEVAERERETVRKMLKDEMEAAAELKVPLVASVHEGESWYDCK